jgi:hypothetical protein
MLFNGGRTYATYAIQTCPKLVANGKPLLCLQSVVCHRYTEAAVPQLERAILAKAAHDRVTLNLCPCHGNHSDPNPVARGRGRGGGRGEAPVGGFARREADPNCAFFPKGLCYCSAHP